MNVAIVNCFDTFWDRQESLRRHFSARGDTVTSLLSDFCHMGKHYRTEAPEKYTLIHANAYRKNISLRRLFSHERFSAAVLRQLKAQKWDLIWVIAPPNSLIQRCMEYKQSYPDTKIVIDINDLWPETFPLGHIKSLPPFHWWKRLRDCHLSKADYIVTECNLFRDRLKLTDYPRCSTIYMCKPLEQVIPVNPAPSLSDSMYSLCYLGSINHIIDIDAIIDIIRAFRTLRPVTLHVIGEGENRDQLLTRAKNAGAQAIYHGAIYNTLEKQRIFDLCHFGLNAMKPSVCVGLTMKSIDYLAGGLPIINTIRGDTWNLVEDCGLGLNWSGTFPSALSRFDFFAARNQARAYFERELTYDHFSRRVEEVLSSL